MTDSGDVVEPTSHAEQLLLAARYGDVPISDVRELLTALPSLVDCLDDQGRTPVHMAAANGHTQMLELLISFGAAPNVANKEGNTALHYAATNNQCEAAKILLAAGWRNSVKDAAGKTPLQQIYELGFEEMEIILIKSDETLDEDVPEGRIVIDDDAAAMVGVDEEQCGNATEGRTDIGSSPYDIQKHANELAKKIGGGQVDDIE